ncbi:MAG: hypothetical protein R3245_10035 [Kiloniellales bacterium]|nr:hypothetical protein [Kiloniellales bacterium]
MWFLSLDGNATVKGQKGDVDVGFSDIWDNLNVAAMFEGEVRKGRMGVFGNIIYADLESENSVSGVDIKADATAVWAGLGVFYRLGPWNLGALKGSGAVPQLIVDPYAGARYTYLNLDLDVKDGGPTFGNNQDWIDPIIGLRSIWQFTPRWSLTTISDIGGFGIGSDLTWQAAGFIGYNFSIFQESDSRLLLGYRAFSQDYTNRNGADKFEWDVIAHGPMAGLAVSF